VRMKHFLKSTSLEHGEKAGERVGVHRTDTPDLQLTVGSYQDRLTFSSIGVSPSFPPCRR
jgi:hypothetical protein